MHQSRVETTRFESPGWWRRAGGEFLFLLGMLVFPLIFFACQKDPQSQAKQEDARKNSAVPVAVQKVLKKNMPLTLRAIGTVEASASVAIKSQVEGELTAVHFKEGE